MTVNLPSEMNDQDIEQFIKAFDDFMQHAETEIDAHQKWKEAERYKDEFYDCLLYTSPSPRDKRQSRMPSSA